MQENGSLETAETMFCRMSVQPAAEAFRKLVQWGARQTPRNYPISSSEILAEQNI
jgi:uncharacterized protein